MRTSGRRSSDLGSRLSRRHRLAAAAAVLAVCAACGKKGPPLTPYDLSPAPPAEVAARRLGDRVYLTFRVPSQSGRGSGPFSVDHLDVFAMTIAPGMIVPPNRALMQKPQTIATIPVRPPDEEASAEEPPADHASAADADRPAPGDAITFVETLSPEVLHPTTIVSKEKPPPEPKAARQRPEGRGTAPAAPTTPAAPVGPAVLTRYYVVRGVTKNGKPGGPSTRVAVPLLVAPAPPRKGPSPSWDATSVTIAWDPPPSRTDEAPGVTYNVYPAPPSDGAAARKDIAPTPLNATPLTATSFTHDGAEAGKEQCFLVRSVAPIDTSTTGSLVTAIESAPSEPICVTPKDTFPPAAPKSVAAVASAGAINLIWDANAEPDLAGYIVLRGEAPGATLQPLMRDPIADTRYTDRTARPGVRYVYEVIAVDKAGNRSAASNRVEEAAR